MRAEKLRAGDGAGHPVDLLCPEKGAPVNSGGKTPVDSGPAGRSFFRSRTGRGALTFASLPKNFPLSC